MWWWIGGFLGLSIIILRANYVVGKINKEMDSEAEEYFKKIDEDFKYSSTHNETIN